MVMTAKYIFKTVTFAFVYRKQSHVPDTFFPYWRVFHVTSASNMPFENTRSFPFAVAQNRIPPGSPLPYREDHSH